MCQSCIRRTAVFLGFAATLCAASSSFAVNPVMGWYGGLMLGPSYTPKQNFTFKSPLTGLPTNGSVSHSVMGDIAGQIGYRCNHYRFEGELLLNYNPIGSLTFGNFTIDKTKNSSTGLGLKGQTVTGALLANAFYDFYSESSSFSPYLGLGVGYATSRTKTKFYYANTLISNSTVSNNANSAAAQLIVGLNYFMDDYTTIGLDYRYFTTATIQHNKANSQNSSRNQINSINIILSGAFDSGS